MDNRATTATATATTAAPPGDGSPSRARGCGCWIALLVVLVLGGAATGYFGATFALRQNHPTDVEATLADAGLRLVMIPGEYQDWHMPPAIANDQAAVARGGKLFEAECALCHGLNGKGPKPGEMGAAMFPPAVPLDRPQTQNKSEGELFYLIWHGINYTGMPAWGNANDPDKIRNGPNTQEEVWSLVKYIKSLK